MLTPTSWRPPRPFLCLLILLGCAVFAALLLSLQLPDISDFKIEDTHFSRFGRPGQRRKQVGPRTEIQVVDTLIETKPPESEIFSFENAPFVHETVKDGKKRLRNIPVKPDHIFVSISSYRDDNCIATLTEIFTKCRFCDRVRVGLVDQVAADDTPCNLPPHLSRFAGQIRIIRMASSLARGPTLARYLTSRLWQGEQYLLQIDAHLTFIRDWDRRLLDMIPQMPSKKFVISHYPVATVEELENPTNAVPFICTAKFDDYMQGLFSQDSSWYTRANHGGTPQGSPFLGAGFMFAPATVLIDCPFDRYLDFLFHGEEFAQSARYWTSGYELVVPLENICSHVYGHRKNNAFVDNPESSHLADVARVRIRYMLGMSQERPERMDEIEDLGLGKLRTFHQYLQYTGVNVVEKKITSHCNDLFDWDTRQWYAIDGPKPPPPPSYKRLVTSIDPDLFPEIAEPVVDYTARVRKAQVPDTIAKGSIFISISSYRDQWCEQTLREIYSKCQNCDRVFVGLVDQTLSGSNDTPCVGPVERHKQISVARLDSTLSAGPTFARFIASKLYDNQEYYLQIDSHLHFVDRWDSELESMIKRMPTTKAVISTYPVIDSTPLEDGTMWVPWICDATFSGNLITQAANSWYNRFNPAVIAANAVPGSSTFLAAGFMFARAQVLVDAPFDRYLPFLFHGEELLVAARLWTRKWDFFVPMRNIVSHLYYERNYTVYRDRADAMTYKAASERRARYLLKLDQEPPQEYQEVRELGLGNDRSIQEFWNFTGLNWETKTMANRCQQIYDYANKKWLPRPAD